MGPKLGRSLIKKMHGTNYNVLRSSGGAYVNGVWTDSTTTIQVFAAKQSLSGHEVVRIPEGDRTRQRFKLYSADFLQPNDDISKARADVVTLPEGKFQVESCEPWTNFYKAIIVKIEHQ